MKGRGRKKGVRMGGVNGIKGRGGEGEVEGRGRKGGGEGRGKGE